MKEQYYELVSDFEDYGTISWELNYEETTKLECVKRTIRTLKDYIDILSKKYPPSEILRWMDALEDDANNEFHYGTFDNLQRRIKTLEALKLKAFEIGVHKELNNVLYEDNEVNDYSLFVFPFHEILTMGFGGTYEEYLFNNIKFINTELAYKLFNDKNNIIARIEELKKQNKNLKDGIKNYQNFIDKNKDEISRLEKELQND